MDTFIKATAGTLVTVIIYLVLSKQGKDLSILLTAAVCCMIAVAALEYIKPVTAFVDRLQNFSNFDTQMLQIILRAVGIGLLTEFTSLICADAGNATLGKTLQLLATGVILWLSLPLFTQLIDTIEGILLVI